MFGAISKIGKALRGIKVRARRIMDRPARVKVKGRVIKKPKPETGRVRKTFNERASELFGRAKNTARADKSARLRKNIIKKFDAAKTLEIKLKIADKAFKHKQYHLAVKLYLKIAEDALQNTEKYCSLSNHLKTRIANLKLVRVKNGSESFFKKTIALLERKSDILSQKLRAGNIAEAPGSYFNILRIKYKKIKSENTDITAALNREFNKTRNSKAKQEIADIAMYFHEDPALAAKFYLEITKGLLELRITEDTVLVEIAENYARLDYIVYMMNPNPECRRPKYSYTEVMIAENCLKTVNELMCKKIREGRFTAGHVEKIKNYMKQMYNMSPNTVGF